MVKYEQIIMKGLSAHKINKFFSISVPALNFLLDDPALPR